MYYCPHNGITGMYYHDEIEFQYHSIDGITSIYYNTPYGKQASITTHTMELQACITTNLMELQYHTIAGMTGIYYNIRYGTQACINTHTLELQSCIIIQ